MTTRRSWGLAVLIGLIGAGGAPGGEADPLEAVEKKILQRWDRITSFAASVDTRMEARLPGKAGTAVGHGTYECLKHEGKLLIRMEISTDMVAKRENEEEKRSRWVRNIHDGEWVYSLIKSEGKKRAVKNKPDPAKPLAVGGKALFEIMHDRWSLRLLPPETGDGRECYVIESRPKGASAKQPEGGSKGQPVPGDATQPTGSDAGKPQAPTTTKPKGETTAPKPENPDAPKEGTPTRPAPGTTAPPPESEPTQATDEDQSRMLHYFDKDTGIRIKLLMYNAKGEHFQTVLLKDIKINPEISPERFKFDPEGVKVQDLSRMRRIPVGGAIKEKVTQD